MRLREAVTRSKFTVVAVALIAATARLAGQHEMPAAAPRSTLVIVSGTPSQPRALVQIQEKMPDRK
jgi:hypothetical protein